MREPVFTGSAVALATPFKNGKVDFETIAKLVEFHVENGTDAIVACATTGEAPTLKDDEHLEAIRFVVKQAKGRLKVIGSTGSNDTAHAVEMSKEAEKLGVDGLLLVTPYYNKTSQAGLVKHYNYVADNVNIPMILYNVPSRTGMGFTAQSYAELAKHPNICGVKEASGNFSLVSQTRSLCPEDFYIWSGNDDQTVPIMSMGGKGVISTSANIVPKVMVEMTHACLKGDFETGMRLQVKYAPLFDLLFCETNPIPLKAAMGMMGMCSGEVRMPLTDMGEGNKEKLRNAMVALGLLK